MRTRRGDSHLPFAGRRFRRASAPLWPRSATLTACISATGRIFRRLSRRREARERALSAMTFDPHPERFLRPARAPRLITPTPERLRLLVERESTRCWCSISTQRWRGSRRGTLSSGFWLRRCAFAACTRGRIFASGTAPGRRARAGRAGRGTGLCRARARAGARARP